MQNSIVVGKTVQGGTKRFRTHSDVLLNHIPEYGTAYGTPRIDSYIKLVYVLILIHFCIALYREKKREKERDELWKKLSELEVSNSNNKSKPNKDSSVPKK